MSPRIYVFMGYGGSGKDTLKEQVMKLDPGVVSIKWSSPMKDMFEELYGLPRGLMYDPVARLQEVPHLPGVNWLDIQNRAYVHLRAIDPHIMTQKVHRVIQTHLNSGCSIVLTDTRTHEEAEILGRLAKHYPLTTVWISRPGLEARFTDEHQKSIFSALTKISTSTWNIYNNGTKEDLATEARRIINGN